MAEVGTSTQGAEGADEQPDDGLTIEERGQLKEMMEADSGSEPGAPAVDEAGEKAGAAKDDAAAGKDGDEPDKAAIDAADKGSDAAKAKDAADKAAKPGDKGDQGEDGDDEDDGDDKADAAASDKPDGDKPPPRRVNYRKYERVEKRAKNAEAANEALKKQLDESAQLSARLDERVRIINEALAAPRADAKAADDDPAPDPEKDIYGYVDWQGRQINKLQESLKGIQQGHQTSANERQLADYYVSDAQELAKREPQFLPAYQFLMDSRVAELAVYYFGKDVRDPATQLSGQELQRIKQTIAGEEQTIVAESIQMKQSPARRVYLLALARGFKPAAAAAGDGDAKKNQAADQGNGADKPTASDKNGADGKPSVKAEIERIRAGVDASTSLSQGGGAPASPLTAEKLANMPEAEFNRMMDELAPEDIQVLMGGG